MSLICDDYSLARLVPFLISWEPGAIRTAVQMNKLKRSVYILLVMTAAAPFLALADGVRVNYREALVDLRMVGADQGIQKTGSPSAKRMSFTAFSRQFDLDLLPNQTLVETVERRKLAADLHIYRGELADSPNSWVRIVTHDGMPRGLVYDGNELYAIEATGSDVTIFRLADLLLESGELSCANVSHASNAADLYEIVAAEVSATSSQGPGATTQIDLAIIGDYEFTNAKGANAQAELVTRMNNVDGIFSSQLGVQLNVNRVDIYPTNNDPFTDQRDPGELLTELVQHRNETATQYENGLSHLFTGRELAGTTAGIAYTGVLCDRRFGAGLTQGNHSVALDSLIAAHEIGHNFGAPHDGDEGEACGAVVGEFLMAPRVNNADTFSDCSITEMQKRVAAASCITALPSTDIAVVAGAQPGNLLLGDSVAVSFDVNSAGTRDATGVILDMTIPAGITVDNVTTNAGNCSSGAGLVSCSIGSLNSGSGATVTLTLTANAVGEVSIDATGAADLDDNASNNEVTLTLTTGPAIDVVAAAQATVQLQLDQSTTLRPTIRNLSPLTASNVAVVITPTAGLQVVSGSWSEGSCAITNAVLECNAASLSPNSSSTISIEVTGIAEGDQSYAIAVSADEIDRDTANNEDSGQVSVGSSVAASTSNSSDDSGGGSPGIVTLFALLATIAMRRREKSLPL